MAKINQSCYAAFEAIESVCRIYNIRFEIYFRGSKGGNYKSNKWVVTAMSKKFTGSDPVKLIGEALIMVGKAHGINYLQDDTGKTKYKRIENKVAVSV